MIINLDSSIDAPENQSPDFDISSFHFHHRHVSTVSANNNFISLFIPLLRKPIEINIVVYFRKLTLNLKNLFCWDIIKVEEYLLQFCYTSVICTFNGFAQRPGAIIRCRVNQTGNIFK